MTGRCTVLVDSTFCRYKIPDAAAAENAGQYESKERALDLDAAGDAAEHLEAAHWQDAGSRNANAIC